MADLATPYQARDHARAKHGTIIEAMPTIPVSHACDLPVEIDRGSLIWDETLAAGEYCSRVLKRGSRLRLINTGGDACAQFLVYNADHPIERLNMADTVKVQWNAYLKEGKLLLSDMGRVLMSITQATARKHDTFCGASSAWSNAKKYGAGENYSPYPNARDRFVIALTKHGLGKKDIPASLNFFKGVKVEEDGSMHFIEKPPTPGQFVELRAEMNVLVVIANCPHVLDPRTTYTATPVRMIGYRGPITPADDLIRNACPENQRAFENVEDYFTE